MEQTLSKPIQDENIIRSGHLGVGDGHELYWVDWGNPAVANPIFHLHGGPGGNFDEKDFSLYDPRVHRVVFHDQRGSGRSTPFASTEHNTTQDLIKDIDRLKDELGFAEISLFGRSWGSTLALLYAIHRPEVIDKMLIGGIFLARHADNDFYLRGQIASHFPEVWERFTAPVPKDQPDPATFYRHMLQSGDDAQRQRFAKGWMLYESSILKLDYVPAAVERNLADFASPSLAYLEAHYILNDCFLEEHYILKHAHKLGGIEKIVIVHGRYDFVCMPSGAYELRRALGENALLHFVAAGHSGSDLVQREVTRAYTNLLWGG